MQPDNKIVNALWVGNRLTNLEMLTLHSFTHHGHEVHLWVYEPIANKLPPGTIIKDANLIIPSEEIFVRKHLDPVAGVGKGSIGAPFSDMFRYKLLYEVGGWWIDMDVTCLQPLDINEPYFFREHLILDVIGNVMKCPPHSRLMHKTYHEVKDRCNADTIDWLLPNKILNKHIRELNLMKYKQTNVSNVDDWNEIRKYIRKPRPIPKDWLFLHWANEEWRMNKIDKDHLRVNNSTFGGLLVKYQLQSPNVNRYRVLQNELRLMKPIAILTRLIALPLNYIRGHLRYYKEKYFKKKANEQ